MLETKLDTGLDARTTTDVMGDDQSDDVAVRKKKGINQSEGMKVVRTAGLTMVLWSEDGGLDCYWPDAH